MTANNRTIGIDDIAMATGSLVLNAAELARATGTDVNKYRLGIGQDAQSVPAEDEDTVTLAAAAARPILDRHGTDGISTVILATESGVDQSKSAGLYVHSLLGLPANVRVVELKQACYGATAGLQFAAGLLSRRGEGKVLVIASDIARYDVGSSGEATQGTAAAAMLVVAGDPAIAVLEQPCGTYSADIMDFWRPNHRTNARVDGKLSVDAYLEATAQAYTAYRADGGGDLDSHAAFCYHQPFTKMAYKAHRNLLGVNDADDSADRLESDLAATAVYNRAIGNSYTASLYLAFISLLDNGPDLTGRPVAMVSYGSGCVAEFFTLTPQPGYRDHLRTEDNRAMIDGRRSIDYAEYLSLREREDQAAAGGDITFSARPGPGYHLTAITDDQRIYAAD